MSIKVSLNDLIGNNLEENFLDFDLTEIQLVLATLSEETAHDLVHAEMLQQKALRGADVISEYLCRVVKTVGYLEAKINSSKNKASLNYTSPDGSRVTAEMRKFAGEISPEVEDLQIKLAKAKASKVVLEKKHDTLIKSFYHFKAIADGLRKTILGYSSEGKIPEGYE